MKYYKYDRRLIPNTYLGKLDSALEPTPDSPTGVSLGFPGWNLLYYALFTSLRANKWNNVIETGTNWGLSTICLAQAIKDAIFDGIVHSVEQNPEHLVRAKENIRNAGLSDYIELYCDDSRNFLKELLPTLSGALSFVFLDSRHYATHVYEEFKTLYPYLDDQAIVYFDNTSYRPNDKQEVYEGVVKILENFGGNIVNFPNSSWGPPGQAIWQKGAFQFRGDP